MSYEPNFTITNKEYILKKFEEILIVIPEKQLNPFRHDKDKNLKGFFDLMSVKSLTDNDLKGLFKCVEDFGDFSNFYNNFQFFLSKNYFNEYWEKKDKYEISLSVNGYSQIKIINYFLYFFICFFDNKNALLKYMKEKYIKMSLAYKIKLNGKKNLNLNLKM